MIGEDGLRGNKLYMRLVVEMRKLWPPAYKAYCQRCMDVTPFVSTFDTGPALRYKEWRELMGKLREEMQLCEIMGEEPAERLAQMRWRLLLDTERLNNALPDGDKLVGDMPEWKCEAATAEQLLRDGEIDGIMECISLMDDEKLDGVPMGDRICQRIFAVWPADYLEYRQRYNAFFKERPAPEDIGPAMEYVEWREVVDKLHVEAQRCERKGVKPGRRHTRLCLLLLRVPGEREPIPD